MKAMLVAMTGMVFVGSVMVLTPRFMLAPKAPPEPVQTVATALDGGGSTLVEANHIRTIPITRKREDRLPMAKQVDTPPDPPATLPIAPEKPKPEIVMPPAAAETDTATPDDATAPRRNRHGGDICARTGGVKITTNHGRSWRCHYRGR